MHLDGDFYSLTHLTALRFFLYYKAGLDRAEGKKQPASAGALFFNLCNKMIPNLKDNCSVVCVASGSWWYGDRQLTRDGNRKTVKKVTLGKKT